MQQAAPVSIAACRRGIDLDGWQRAFPSLRFGTLVLFSIGLATLGSAAQTAGPWFVDRAGERGIDSPLLYGGAEKRFITEAGGSGAGWIDFDMDGRLDLFLPNALAAPAERPSEAAGHVTSSGQLGASEALLGHRLYRATGGVFTEVAGLAGVARLAWANGVAVGDFDNDGWSDVYVSAIGTNQLFRNNGDGTFAAVYVGVEDPGWSTSSVFVDWEGDGDLDLYVPNYVDFDARKASESACHFHLRGVEVFCGPHGLAGQRDALYRNDADGSWSRWPGATIDPEATYSLAALATDCDGDRLPEVYVATDSTMNQMYRRDHTGAPEDWSFLSGAGLSAAGVPQAGMGVSAGDFDGDGRMDLTVSNFQHDRNNLYRGLGECSYEDVGETVGIALPSVPYMGWGTLLIDVDGDADLDVFTANGHIYPQVDQARADEGDRAELFDPRRDPEHLETYAQRNLLFVNRLRQTGEATFDEVGESSGPGLARRAVSRGASYADYDNDGDLDILVSNLGAAPTLLTNEGRMARRAIRLTLIGRQSNRSAYGARVGVLSGGVSQVYELRHSDGYLGSNDPRLLIFLPGETVDRLEISWPSGARLELTGLEPAWLVIDEARGVIARLPIE